MAGHRLGLSADRDQNLRGCCQIDETAAKKGKILAQAVAKIWATCFDDITRNILGASAASATMAGRLNWSQIMKKIALAAALSMAASTSFAGGTVEPVTPAAPVAPTSSSAGGLVVPLLLLLVVAAAASN